MLSKNETVSLGEIERLVAGQHHDPHSVLGAHPAPSEGPVMEGPVVEGPVVEGPVVEGTVIRALRPLATSVVAVLPDGSRHPMTHRHLGVFEVTVPAEHDSVLDYRLEVAYVTGEPQLQDDPYRHLPTIGEFDLHLIGEGRHEQLWRALGARPMKSEPAATGPGETGPSEIGPNEIGTAFAVWAPNARGVRVVGDFNFWDGRRHAMRVRGNGYWEIFVPAARAGDKYK